MRLQSYFIVLAVSLCGIGRISGDEAEDRAVAAIEGGAVDAFDLGEITQEMPDTPRMNWQAPYDDQVISETDGKAHVVFFFHYLDVNKPLLSPAGSLALPAPKKLPPRLKTIMYEAP